MTTTFLDRAGWGGGPVASGHLVPEAQFVGLVEHHTVIVLPDYDHDGMTAGDLDDAIRYMQALKVARPDLGPDVPYSFVVFEGATPNDCIVGEGRGRGITGAHTIGYNSTRYGCAWAGDYTSKSPTPGMYEGLRWIGRTMLVDPGQAVPTLQHRDVYQTACPGASSVAPSPAQPPFTAAQEEDMRPSPSTAIDHAGRVWEFVRGVDGLLYAQVETPRVVNEAGIPEVKSPWFHVRNDFGIDGGPAAVVLADGRIKVTAAFPDGTLHGVLISPNPAGVDAPVGNVSGWFNLGGLS